MTRDATTTAHTARERKQQEKVHTEYARAMETAYRQWQIFVREEQAQLTDEYNGSDASDDDLTRPAGRASDSARRSKLTKAERRTLAAVFEQRRQTGGFAPDTTGRQLLLAQIASELNGTASGGPQRPEGWALLWYGGKLVPFNHHAVVGRVAEADYAKPSRIQPRTLAIVAAGGLVVLCIVVTIIRSALGGGSVLPPAPAQISINGTTTRVDPLASVQIGAATFAAQLRLAYPPLVCLPSGTALSGKETSGVFTRTTSIDTYDLGPASTTSDLTLGVCDAGSKRLSGRLRTTQLVVAPLEPVISTTTTLGPDTDPSRIAADQMIVVMELADQAWQDAVLITADGARWPVAGRDDHTVRFLVPLLATSQRAALERAGSSSLPQVAPLDIPAPLGRLALLQQQVQIQHLSAKRTGQEVTITATLYLDHTATPLTLLPTDAALDSGNDTTPTLHWSPPTLAPRTPTTVTLTIPGGTSATTVTLVGTTFFVATT